MKRLHDGGVCKWKGYIHDRRVYSLGRHYWIKLELATPAASYKLLPGLAKTRVISLLPSPVGFSGFTRVFLGFVGNTGSYDNALPQVQVK